MRPAEPGDAQHAGSDGRLREHDGRGQADVAHEGIVGECPEHQAVGRHDDEKAPDDRPFAQPCRLPLQVEQPAAAGGEAVDRPAREAEEADFLGRRRVDGKAVGVVGVALGFEHLVGLAVAPNGAFAQEHVGREPAGDEEQRRPPGVSGQHDRRGDARSQFDEADRDEVHADGERRAGDAEVEVAGHGEVGGQVGPFEVGDPGRVDAGTREPVGEQRRRSAPEIRADSEVERVECLEQDEDSAHHDERDDEAGAVVDGADEDAHGDREDRRQRATQHDERPPRDRQRPRRAEQHAEELPFVGGEEAS